MSTYESEPRWHEAVFPTLHLTLTKPDNHGCAESEDFEGDYLLSISERSPGGCRWELAIPPKCGLGTMVVVVQPSQNESVFESHIYIEGTSAGPQWRAIGLADFKSAYSARFDSKSAANPTAGCNWPQIVQVTPVSAALPSRGHHLSHQSSPNAYFETLEVAGCGSSYSHPPTCPSCEPEDPNCHCGEQPQGLWCYFDTNTMAVRDFGTQRFYCPNTGLLCSGSVRISIKGLRYALVPPNLPNSCTCFFYTSTQIIFFYSGITCPGGVVCGNFTNYLYGADIWPGAWIYGAGCLALYSAWYLEHCVTVPTFDGFNITNFDKGVAALEICCGGEAQEPPCGDPACPSSAFSCNA